MNFEKKSFFNCMIVEIAHAGKLDYEMRLGNADVFNSQSAQRTVLSL
jgi:hypothetical protein